MKRLFACPTWIHPTLVSIAVFALLLVAGSPATSTAEEAETLSKALETVPATQLKGKTQDEIRSELPTSAAYRDETSPVSEEMTVTGAAGTETEIGRASCRERV